MKVSSCPVCHHESARIQSRYTRHLTDLPWQGVPVLLLLTVRRFFWDNAHCPRRIFSERLPQVAPAYARKTDRLLSSLQTLGLALGGRGGARLAHHLRISVSRTMLLGLLRRVPLPQGDPLKIIGVDDFSFCRGQRYGTLLVDLETHRPIDMLTDRKSDSLAQWLQPYPEIEVVSRDRSGAYADGACRGAPQAIQVADRWHLLKNCIEAMERLLQRHSSQLRQVAQSLSQEENASQNGQQAPDFSMQEPGEPQPPQNR